MKTKETNSDHNGVLYKAYFLSFWRKWYSIQFFSNLIKLNFAFVVLAIFYWFLIASDRYVSQASVLIRKTDSALASSVNFSALITGVGGINRPEQLLLQEYMQSVDMLRKLDAKLNLKAHYQDSSHDWVSRMWLNDIEWFHRYYLSRVTIEYDDYAGVLRIRAEAYEPKMAKAIADILVQEGESYMNQMGHELAQTQVNFLTAEVNMAQLRLQQANQRLLVFQNKKGLLSPQATAENLIALIGRLEGQRADLQTQLASLPKNLDKDHPNTVMLKQALSAVDKQISEEKAKLANPSGKTLNFTVEEFQRLQTEVTFAQDLYKTALIALEQGRVEATRLLEKVAVLQVPTLPEYPLEPRRIYNTVVTVLFGLMLAGIMKLLQSIVEDHLD